MTTTVAPYVCPRCGAVSHHPVDKRERYCARCHQFEDDREWPALAAAITAAVAIGEQTKGRPGAGAIPCPVCTTGTVTYTVTAARALRAACSTEGCLVLLA